jgi:SAM-dependent methyltransferase
MPTMPLDDFCCPDCKNPLGVAPTSLVCTVCNRQFPIVNGIPDFFSIVGEAQVIDEANQTWLDPGVVQARDTIYRLCTRELRGMAFCMQEIASRTGTGIRILEAGMGTGHFTRWLAELAAPGTEFYAFDFSWPIIQTAQGNLHGFSTVNLFRANARGKLPFPDHSFDILFMRLAPLGPHGVPNVAAGFQLLKPGGWYFEACWERPQYDLTWTGWAIQHGFQQAEHHSWQYPRKVTAEEERARQVEQAAFPELQKETSPVHPGNVKITIENLLIAQKPFN